MIAVYENNDRLSLRFHSLAESRDLQPLSRLPEDFLADILGTVRSFPPYSTPPPSSRGKGKREKREEGTIRDSLECRLKCRRII